MAHDTPSIQRQNASNLRKKRAARVLRNLTTPRRQRIPYYAARRVPQTFSPTYLRRRLLPLLPLGLGAVGATVASALPFGKAFQDAAWATSEELSSQLTERSQKLFFDNPGLDTLAVRALATHVGRMTRLAAFYMRAKVRLGMDSSGKSAIMAPLLPTRNYDALAVFMLVTGTALGYFAGGHCHATLIYDNGHLEDPVRPLPAGHVRAKPRRMSAPHSLADVCADIDDLYWAEGRGQCVKIVAVGQGSRRRWIVALPGTAHMNPGSNENPADIESNVREVLSLPSGMRRGVLRAIHHAMTAVGASSHDSEKILIVGHSQGGMIATALAGQHPSVAGINVAAVVSTGSPNRRIKIRPDVVMLSVAHDQDIVPSTDGSADRSIDHRVNIRRHLNRPRTSPLYYAHASMTYTETVRYLERRARINPFGRIPETIRTLQSYLPEADEPTRVFIYDIWQELLIPHEDDTWNRIAELKDYDPVPVDQETTYAPASLIPYDAFTTSWDGLRKWWNNDTGQ